MEQKIEQARREFNAILEYVIDGLWSGRCDHSPELFSSIRSSASSGSSEKKSWLSVDTIHNNR
jgi:hypothetical protein